MDETNNNNGFKWMKKTQCNAALGTICSSNSIQTFTTTISEIIFAETENDRRRKRKRERICFLSVTGALAYFQT